MNLDTFAYKFGGATLLPAAGTAFVISEPTAGWDWIYIEILPTNVVTTFSFNVQGNTWLNLHHLAAAPTTHARWIFQLDVNIPPYVSIVQASGAAGVQIAWNFMRGYPIMPVMYSGV
jgi:hypothetical protein